MIAARQVFSFIIFVRLCLFLLYKKTVTMFMTPVPAVLKQFHLTRNLVYDVSFAFIAIRIQIFRLLIILLFFLFRRFREASRFQFIDGIYRIGRQSFAFCLK